jgi:UDP-N-acetylglucosamine 2-epimerase (non-hydrolysing)
MKLAIILGTRPEIIKLSPIIKELKAREIKYISIDTGQHESIEMRDCFYAELGIVPTHALFDYDWERTGVLIRDILLSEKVNIALVQGDTNSTLLGAVAAIACNLPLVHVEAGLRCGDFAMTEERNRIMVDHMAEYLFPPTDDALRNLTQEKIHACVFPYCGHLIADVMHQTNAQAKPHDGLGYILLTLHRRETVDNLFLFRDALSAVHKIATAHNLDVIYPVHPRAQAKLKEFGIELHGRFKAYGPLAFHEFISLEETAQLIMTDSGGIQEEACILGVPCVTIRDCTERPETIRLGANIVAGYDEKNIIACANEMLEAKRVWQHPYGDGHAATRIIDQLICNSCYEDGAKK